MKIRFSLLVVWLLLNQMAIGQKQHRIDSLKTLMSETNLDSVRIDALNGIVWEIMTSDTMEAAKYWNRAVHLSAKSGYDLGLADAYFNYGFIKMQLGRMDSARWYYHRSHEYAIKANHPKTIARALSQIGVTFYYQSAYEAARIYLLKSNDVLQSNGEFTQMANNWLNLGNIFYDQDQYDSSRLFYDKALFMFDSARDQLKVSLCLQNIGNIYSSENDYPKSLDYYLRALHISESIQDSTGIAYVLGNIGNIYNNQDEPDLALEYHFRSLEMKEQLGMAYSMIYTFYNLGWIYISKEEFANAEKYLQQCLNSSQSLDNPFMLAYAHSGLGEVYLEFQQYQLAREHLEKAQEIRVDLEIPEELAETLNLLGKLAQLNEEYGSAKTFLAESMSIGKSLKIPDLIRTSAEYSANLYAALGDYKRAYEFHVQFKAMDDSIKNEDNTRKITLLESEYEFQKEKEQIEATNKLQSRKQEEQLQQQRYFTYASTGGLFSIMMIAFFIYRNFRQKQKANRLLEEKNDQIHHQAQELEHKNQDLKELSTFKQGLTDMIAHDMKNPLNVVIGLSEGEPDTHKMQQVNQSGKLMLQMVTNMLDVQKFDEAEMKLNQAPHTLMDILIQAKYQVELLSMARSIQLDFQVSKDLHLECDREIIMRVLVNLFTNGIKYSDPGGSITIKATKKDQRARISVSDTGKGIHPEDLPFVFEKFWQAEARKSGLVQSTGLGLTFCKIAVKAHGGTITVTSAPSAGSTFEFDLPLANVPLYEEEKYIELSNPEVGAIQEIIQEIRQIPLYQFVDIEEALQRIPIKSKSLQTWKEALISAALNWNEEQFEKLLTLHEMTQS